MCGNNSLMPCGKKDCSGCTECKYDLPLDSPLLKNTTNYTKMKNFGVMPLANNPSTTQLILPGVNDKRTLPPLKDGEPQLLLPFKGIDPKESIFCNGCEHFLKIERPNKGSFNTRCTSETPRPGGSYRVIKLNVFPDEKVKKPFWCPVLKGIISKNVESSLQNKGFPSSSPIAAKEEEFKRKKEKWLGMSGLTSWADIKVGERYHMPPTIRRGRMEFVVKNKYMNSIQGYNEKEGINVWLYKEDEEYKFLSVVKK